MEDKAATGPTARLLKPGEVYVAGYALIIPNIEVGVTDRLQFGGGILPYVFWVTPKVQLFRNERRAVAVGTLQVFAPGEFAGGLAYLNTTREMGQGALTLGAGWAYSTDDGTFRLASGAPVVQLGAERQVNTRWAFVTENYIAWGLGWISGGGRYQRTSALRRGCRDPRPRRRRRRHRRSDDQSVLEVLGAIGR